MAGTPTRQRSLRYYGMEITPEEVAERALLEIRDVRRLMAETAAAYWAEVHAETPAGPSERPGDEGALVTGALAEMEKDRASTQLESLELFTRFADEAEAFVREAGIATLRIGIIGAWRPLSALAST